MGTNYFPEGKRRKPEKEFTFFENNPGVLTAAFENAHKFVPDTVMSMGSDSGLAGSMGVLGSFLRPQKDDGKKSE